MRSKIRFAAVGVSVLAVLAFSGAAMATNGYFTHGVGAESKGMAGTGIGSDGFSGAIIVASNPALGVFADDNWEVGMSFFSPRRSYKAGSSFVNGQFGAFTIGAGKFDSGSEWFPIPYVAKNWRLANGNAITLAFYGRGGMNTDWDNSDASATFDPDGPGPAPVSTLPGPFGGGDAGVDLSQAFLMVNYAGKGGEDFAWGIGPVFALQMFEAKGVGSYAGYTKTFAASGGTAFPDSLTNNGHEVSTGFGGAVGIWRALGDSASFGLSYTSKMSMSEFDDYADLFAEAGGFDIPSSAKLGFSFGRGSNILVNLDIEHTRFSEVDSVGNPLVNIAACPTAGLGGTDIESCLGGNRGAGFGWDDMTTYKIGVEWIADASTTWRFGYSYGEQPINEADVLFNILAPGVMEQHLTLGLRKGKWNFSMMYAPPFSVEGQNLFDPTQLIELKMTQFEFELSYTF